MNDLTRTLANDFVYCINNSKLYVSKKASQITSILIIIFSAYVVCCKKGAKNKEKNNKRITIDTLTLEDNRLKHDNFNTKKIEKKYNSIYDLLLFIVYCGMFFSFLILIWNIHSEDWNVELFYFGIFFIVLVIAIILLKRRRKSKKM